MSLGVLGLGINVRWVDLALGVGVRGLDGLWVLARWGVNGLVG